MAWSDTKDMKEMLDNYQNENWQFNCGVLQRNQYMFENGLATDITFMVGNDHKENIEAHKYVLISGSPVFLSMFCGELKEEGDVFVPDIEPKAFKEMLRHLYYEQCNITGEYVMQILYASKKYMIPALTKLCQLYLEKHLSSQNACVILQHCDQMDEPAIAEKCMKIIRHQTHDILRSSGFNQISCDILIKILQDDELGGKDGKEVDLFLACVEWATYQIQQKPVSQQKFDGQNLRLQLGEALFQIRFTLMTFEEFGEVVVKTGILNAKEEMLCFRYLSQKTKPEEFLFPLKPRKSNITHYSKQSESKYDIKEEKLFQPQMCLVPGSKFITDISKSKVDIGNRFIFHVKNNNSSPINIVKFKGLFHCSDITISFQSFNTHNSERNWSSNIQADQVEHQSKSHWRKNLLLKGPITVPSHKSVTFKIKCSKKNPLVHCFTFCHREPIKFCCENILATVSSDQSVLPLIGIYFYNGC